MCVRESHTSSMMVWALWLAGSLSLCLAKTWVWQGALQPTSIEFKLKTDEPEFRLVALAANHSVHVAKLVKGGMFQFPAEEGSGWNASTTRLLHLSLDNLQANTSYTWSGTGDVAGRFTTPPAAGTRFNFTFALGSCADNDSNSDIFAFMARNQDPLFFVHMGDLHYGNLEVNDEREFAKLYDRTLLHNQSRLYNNLPVVYMWDDHDFGPNNADKSSPSRPAALATYRRFTPHYALPGVEADSAVFHSFAIGRVLFLVTDTSSQREGNTTLGKEQLDWLLGQLAWLASPSSPHQAGVWVNTMPWIDDFYKWGEFAQERERIAGEITRLELSRKLIIVSGDAHMLAVDDGTNAKGGVRVFHAAAIDAKPTTKGGPYSHGAFPGRNQYGTVRVADNGREICFTFQGWRFTGRGTAKRMVVFDTCDLLASSPPRPFTPSPHYVQQTWKRAKRLLEQTHAGVQLAVWVDSSSVTLSTFLELAPPALAVGALGLAAFFLL